jgi:RHS repeat-associated protein
MMVRYLVCTAIVLAFATLGSHICIAQESYDGHTPSGAASGSPLGSYSISGFDSINYYNGGLSFSLPLAHISGRGGLGYTMYVNIESHWGAKLGPPQQPDDDPRYTYTWTGGYDTNNARYSPGRMDGRAVAIPFLTCPGTGGTASVYTTVLKLSYKSANGTTTELVDTNSNGAVSQIPCNGGGADRGTIFTSRDGSAMTYISDVHLFDQDSSSFNSNNLNGWLMFRDGTRYRIDNSRVKKIVDRNGNFIEFEYGAGNGVGAGYKVISIRDSIKRLITIEYDVNDGLYGICDRITMHRNPSSDDRVFRVSTGDLSTLLQSGTGPIHIQSLFSGMTDFIFNPKMVSKIWLPNGKYYGLLYNEYAEISRVTLPTDGAIEYSWGPGVTSTYNGWLYPIFTGVYRRVLERRTYPSGGTGSGWEQKIEISSPDYQVSQPAAGFVYGSSGIVEVRTWAQGDILLSNEKHYYHGSAARSFEMPAEYFNYWDDGLEWKTEYLIGSTVIRTMTQDWATRIPVTYTPQDPSGITYQTSPPNEPRMIETRVSLAETNKVSKRTFDYDALNNVTNVYEYGFGAGAPGPLLRRSQTTYLTNNPKQDNINYATDLNIHIRNLPVDVTVFDGNGKKVAETGYVYDAYGTTGFPILQDCPLIVQHDPAFHHNYVTRGNLVQISKVIRFSADSTPTGYINNNFQYDLAGNLVKKIDGRGNEISIDYTDRFGAPDGEARSNIGPAELGGQFSYAFPTVVVKPLGLVTRTQYDYYTGKAVDVEDPNNFTSSFYYEDVLDRPTKMINAVGTGLARQTLYVYNDNASAVDGNPAHSITTISDKTNIGESGSGNGLKSLVLYDGLGRTRRKAVYEGDTSEGNTWLITDIQFDALGRTWKLSNPFRLNSPDGVTATSEWTTTEYDALSRVIKITTPDGAHVDTVYAGNQVTVTDQAGKKRRSETDALGRLTKVTEDPSGVNYDTTYIFDALNNLIKVTQGSQTRTFAYDSLSRLISASNPENGTITYAYDANGNLLSKIDARNITTNYTYDDLNRNTRIEYSSYDNGSSVVERYYDNPSTGKNGKGRFWYEIAQNKRWEQTTNNLAYQQSTVDSYDALGRPLSLTQGYQLANASYKNFILHRNYDLAGNVTSQSYPSSRAVTYTMDTAGRLKSFQGSIGDFVSRAYVTDIRYNGYGSVSREAYGTQTPLYLNMHYNNRLQMVDLRLGTNAVDENDLSGGALTYYYGTNAKNSGNPLANSADNNGNVLRHVNTVPLAGGSQVVPQMDDYSYDALNRITAVNEQQRSQDGTLIPIFTQGFSYDQWGNRTINLGATTIGIPGVTRKIFAIDTVTNRMTSVDGVGMTYDAAGNQTNDGVGVRYYDNENRMTKVVQGGQTHYYFYDASGKRLRRILNGSQTSGGVETWFVYGFDGELVAEYTYNQVSPPSNTAAIKEYGYRNGKLLVVWDGTQSGDKRLKWLVADHLGSTRMEVDRSGSLAEVARIDNLPFGEELSAGVGIRSASIGYGGDSVRQKFVGYEQDDETGLDFAGARYYSNIQGRFTSPDPAHASGKTEEPQSWNRYAYCINYPLGCTDPSGLIWGFLQTNAGDSYVWYKTKEEMDAAGATAVNANANSNAFVYQAANGAFIRLDLGQNSWRGYETEGEAYIGRTLADDGSSSLGDLGETFNIILGAQGAAGLARLGGGSALARILGTRSTSTSLVNAQEEIFDAAVFQSSTGTAEQIGAYTIFGNKGLVGTTFNRNIFLIEAAKGSKSLSGLRSLAGTLEAEASAAGANQISIVGHAIVNRGFLNPAVAQRMGYTFRQINSETIQLLKTLPPK